MPDLFIENPDHPGSMLARRDAPDIAREDWCQRLAAMIAEAASTAQR